MGPAFKYKSFGHVGHWRTLIGKWDKCSAVVQSNLPNQFYYSLVLSSTTKCIMPIWVYYSNLSGSLQFDSFMKLWDNFATVESSHVHDHWYSYCGIQVGIFSTWQTSDTDTQILSQLRQTNKVQVKCNKFSWKTQLPTILSKDQPIIVSTTAPISGVMDNGSLINARDNYYVLNNNGRFT